MWQHWCQGSRQWIEGKTIAANIAELPELVRKY
jgi:hypothetical protein